MIINHAENIATVEQYTRNYSDALDVPLTEEQIKTAVDNADYRRAVLSLLAIPLHLVAHAPATSTLAQRYNRLSNQITAIVEKL